MRRLFQAAGLGEPLLEAIESLSSLRGPTELSGRTVGEGNAGCGDGAVVLDESSIEIGKTQKRLQLFPTAPDR